MSGRLLNFKITTCGDRNILSANDQQKRNEFNETCTRENSNGYDSKYSDGSNTTDTDFDLKPSRNVSFKNKNTKKVKFDDNLKVYELPNANKHNLDENKQTEKKDQSIPQDSSSEKSSAFSKKQVQKEKCSGERDVKVDVEEKPECDRSSGELNSFAKEVPTEENKVRNDEEAKKAVDQRCQTCISYFVKGCNFC